MLDEFSEQRICFHAYVNNPSKEKAELSLDPAEKTQTHY